MRKEHGLDDRPVVAGKILGFEAYSKVYEIWLSALQDITGLKLSEY